MPMAIALKILVGSKYSVLQMNTRVTSVFSKVDPTKFVIYYYIEPLFQMVHLSLCQQFCVKSAFQS